MKKIDSKVITEIKKLKREGFTIPQIAKEIKVSDYTVKKYTKYLIIKRNKRQSGRPKKISNPIPKQVMADFKENKLKNLVDGCLQVAEEYKISVCKTTISNYLKQAELKCFRKQSKPALTNNYVKKRLNFVKKFLEYNFQGRQRIIWSGESSFDLISSSKTEYYWNNK
jgi:transposase